MAALTVQRYIRGFLERNRMKKLQERVIVDSFTVSLHNPNSRWCICRLCCTRGLSVTCVNVGNGLWYERRLPVENHVLRGHLSNMNVILKIYIYIYIQTENCPGSNGEMSQHHYSNVIMSAMASQIKASPLFSQPFFQAHIKAPRHSGLCERDRSATGGFPSQTASNAENVSIW